MDRTLSGFLLDKSATHPLCQYDRGYSMMRMGDMKLKEVKQQHPSTEFLLTINECSGRLAM